MERTALRWTQPWILVWGGVGLLAVMLTEVGDLGTPLWFLQSFGASWESSQERQRCLGRGDLLSTPAPQWSFGGHNIPVRIWKVMRNNRSKRWRIRTLWSGAYHERALGNQARCSMSLCNQRTWSCVEHVGAIHQIFLILSFHVLVGPYCSHLTCFTSEMWNVPLPAEALRPRMWSVTFSLSFLHCGGCGWNI